MIVALNINGIISAMNCPICNKNPSLYCNDIDGLAETGWYCHCKGEDAHCDSLGEDNIIEGAYGGCTKEQAILLWNTNVTKWIEKGEK